MVKQKTKINFIILSIILITPYISFAQFFSRTSSVGSPNSLQGLIIRFLDIISLLIPLAVSSAVLFFFWGLAKFILYSGSEDKRKEAKHVMIWGVLALFIMVTIGGIIALLDSTFLGGFGTLPLFP